jgi:hypothetical protein
VNENIHATQAQDKHEANLLTPGHAKTAQYEERKDDKREFLGDIDSCIRIVKCIRVDAFSRYPHVPEFGDRYTLEDAGKEGFNAVQNSEPQETPAHQSHRPINCNA